MTNVQVKLTAGANGEQTAGVKVGFGLGKVFDPRLPQNLRKSIIPPHVQGMLRFYEQVLTVDTAELTVEARKEFLDLYRQLVLMDAAGLEFMQLRFDTEGNLKGFKEDTEVELVTEESKVIYKIRARVGEYRPRAREKHLEVLYKEKTVIGNLDRARNIYKSLLNEVKSYMDYSKYSGFAELFIPHIHENGETAYWPDNDEYIDRFVKEN